MALNFIYLPLPNLLGHRIVHRKLQEQFLKLTVLILEKGIAG